MTRRERWSVDLYRDPDIPEAWTFSVCRFRWDPTYREWDHIEEDCRHGGLHRTKTEAMAEARRVRRDVQP